MRLSIMGVIDGAEHDGNVYNCVSRLYDVILGGPLVLYLSACVPAYQQFNQQHVYYKTYVQKLSEFGITEPP